jgi:hypothetical protein
MTASASPGVSPVRGGTGQNKNFGASTDHDLGRKHIAWPGSPHLDIPRSYLSRGFGRFVGEKVRELFGEAVGGATL